MAIINIPADVWRLLFKDHPEYRRCFRLVCKRARDIFPITDNSWQRKLTEDVFDLCRNGCHRILSFYPKAALLQFSWEHMYIAIQNGHLEIVQMMVAVETNYGIYLAAHAARIKQYDIVRWLVANYDPKFEGVTDQIEDVFQRNYEIAANGDLEIVKEFFQRDPTCPSRYNQRNPICPGWYKGAIDGKHLAIIQWLHEQKCEFPEDSSQRAAISGSLEIFQWLCEHGCPCNPKVCASSTSCPEIRDWIHQRYPQ